MPNAAIRVIGTYVGRRFDRMISCSENRADHSNGPVYLGLAKKLSGMTTVAVTSTHKKTMILSIFETAFHPLG